MSMTDDLVERLRAYRCDKLSSCWFHHLRIADEAAEEIERLRAVGPPYSSAQLRMMCAMTNPPKPLGFDIVVDGKTIAVLELTEFKKAMAFFVEKDETWRQRRQRLVMAELAETPRAELERRVNAMLDKELPR